MNIPAYPVSQLLALLHEAKVRASVHRLAVLRYVVDKRTHPTADEIYTSVSADFPSLSRATVYNSLHTLADNGILRELEIEAGSTRYDFALQPPHGHFICKCCRRIYDMEIPGDLGAVVADGFLAHSVDLYAKGICPECRNISQ